MFTLGADASTALATITAINYPSISGVDFTQIKPNGTKLPDCIVGLSLSNAAPSCMLKVSIEGESGKSVDDDIEVVTDVQTLPIAIQTSFVSTGSTSLPQGQVSPAPIVAPDTSVQIKVNNSQANTESFNNLHVTLPSWLADIATNLVGGTVSTNGDGNTVITYTVNGANVNLAPGQTHTFSFDLGGDEATTLVLLAYYDELIDNSSSKIIVVNASNLRNPITPSLTVSLTPATMTEEVTLSDPDEPQTVTLQNLSNSQLRLTEINTDNLPNGVTIVEGVGTTCSTEVDINPAGDAGDSCTVQLTVADDTVPEDNKTLNIDYVDPQGNAFEDSTAVTIGGAEIVINGFNSIELPMDGDKTTNVTITNTGTLSWLPSNMAENYEITQQGQSTPAANISVIAPTAGTNCLIGAAVVPALTCNIGIQVNADDTATGNYVLNVLPANNLETTYTKNFSITEPTLGSFLFLNGDDDITSQNFEIGDSPITVTLANVGAVEITGAYLTIPDKFTTDDPDVGVTCPEAAGNAISLANGASCSLKLSVANGSGIGAGSYNIVATGDAETVDSPQTLTATVQGVVVTIESNVGIPKPNDGSDPVVGKVTITNNGANTIIWNPSMNVNDYIISGTNTTGISVVDPGDTDNPYCLTDSNADGMADPVAIGGKCDLGIQATSAAAMDTYTLTLVLANNLAAAQSQDFNVTGALGFFSFSPTNITIGTNSTDQPQEITLSNDGIMDITGVYLTQHEPDDIIVTDNNCGTDAENTVTLNAGESCTFNVAADNTAGQGDGYAFSVLGDDGTVENNNTTFTVTVDGVVVQIETINDGEAINRPAAGPQTTNVELTNLGNEGWNPATTAAGYQISRVDEVAIENISVVNGASGEEDPIENCWSVENVAAGGSCYVGIQTNANTPETDYTLRVLAQVASLNTIPQASKIQTFTIEESLGYFTYSGEGIVNNELNMTIGGEEVTVTLTNIGETQIQNITISSNDMGVVGVENNGCAAAVLNENDTCTFKLVAEGVGSATITATSDDTSNSPASLTVMAVELLPRFVPVEGQPDCMIDNETNLMIAKSGILAQPNGQSWTNAEIDPAGANAMNGGAGLCGHNDWRQPTILELAGNNPNTGATGTGIITGWDTENICGDGDDEACNSPVSWLQAQGFGSFYTDPDQQARGNYWSSTENDFNLSTAWAVCLAASCFFGTIDPGDIFDYGKNGQIGVLPVRSN